MDVFTSEKKLVDGSAVEAALKVLEDKGDLYVGVLERPKGHDVEDWEPRPQTLFRATAYGDDVDRPLKKSDGSWTYFASDIAYHLDKFHRGFSQMIDVLGADHSGYVKRIQAATAAVTGGHGHVEVKTCQMVNFMENGVPIKMSKRAGNFIKLRDLTDRVGKDVTRFIMLTRHHDNTIDFDFAKVVEQTRENPVFYVQYAHARVCSVLKHGLDLFPGALDDLSKINVSLLTDVSELEMIKLLVSWPRQVEVAAVFREPHRIAYYLHDVAAAFHGLWNKGKDHTYLRFIDPEDRAITSARLALVKGVAMVIASGLELFGITPLQEMR
jgi:arginyl-tRNA synthetase